MEEQLVFTLCYLAHGLPQYSRFGVGRQTESDIVKQVCTALHKELAPIFTSILLYSRMNGTISQWTSKNALRFTTLYWSNYVCICMYIIIKIHHVNKNKSLIIGDL